MTQKWTDSEKHYCPKCEQQINSIVAMSGKCNICRKSFKPFLTLAKNKKLNLGNMKGIK